MSSLEGRLWYCEEYLQSEKWKKTKEKTYRLRKKACEFCKKRYDLNVHHLFYDRVGTALEFKDCRLLCRYHHKYFCHRVLFFIRVPTTSIFLNLLFYFWLGIFNIKKKLHP